MSVRFNYQRDVRRRDAKSSRVAIFKLQSRLMHALLQLACQFRRRTSIAEGGGRGGDNRKTVNWLTDDNESLYCYLLLLCAALAGKRFCQIRVTLP